MKQEMIINNQKLDQNQLKAIYDNPKYSLIIAGAGSGKTTTIVGKVKYLLTNKKLKSQEICCLSFTNEATQNLKKALYQNTNQNITCLTFHKLALQILDKKNIDFLLTDETLKEQIINNFLNNQFKQNTYTKTAIYKYYKLLGPFKNYRLKKINHTKLAKKINNFLTIFQSYNLNKLSWHNLFSQSKEKPFLILCYTIYIIYTNYKSKNSIFDFDDLIINATKIIKQNNNFLPYKIIIIDEWQDTSLIRLNLIKEISKKTNAAICACGDDYQAIYRFQGCDLNIFLKFKDIFPNTKYYFLNNTYRTSQELINLATKFILKNKSQIKKQLKSNKKNPKPIKIIYEKNKKQTLNKVIKLIPPNETIFILARNSFDLKKYTNETFTGRIRFLTVHKSKGLESDNVIILNMIKDTYGFPSLKKESELIKIINPQKMNYEEERRLFYVALTRAKKNVYLLTNKQNPSIFIEEIKKEKEVEIIKI